MQSVRPGIRACGRAVRAAASRRGCRITVVVVLALLAGGCADHTALPAAGGGHATSSPSPTATPMTAAERDWVAAIAHLHNKIDKPFTAPTMTLTRAKMTQLE